MLIMQSPANSRVHTEPRIRIECALNLLLGASPRDAHSRKRIIMRITQSTSVRGLNPDWPSPAISHASRALGESGLATQDYHREACEMAGTAWSVEETRALLNLDQVLRVAKSARRMSNINIKAILLGTRIIDIRCVDIILRERWS